MFLSFGKNKEPKCISVQIEKKKLKGPPFYSQKSGDQKYLWRSRNYCKPSKSIIRFLTIAFRNFGKGKRQSVKK